jgi:propanediol utilization protein
VIVVLLLNRFKVDRSANHCHLTKEHAELFFGNSVFTLKELAIAGEFATNLKLEDHRGNKYTVLYPWREYTQIEVAQSDYYKLFGHYGDRVNSGDLSKASFVVVQDVYLPLIVVKAHVHIARESDIDLLDFLDFPFKLEIKMNESTDGFSHMHLDTDQYAAIQGVL